MKNAWFILLLIGIEISGIPGLPNLEVKDGESTRTILDLNGPLSVRRPFSPYVPQSDQWLNNLKQRLEETKEVNILFQKFTPFNESTNDPYKLQIHGFKILLSYINVEEYCKGKAGYFEIFALDEILINDDFVCGGKVQVVAVAPKIRVLGKRQINLNGANGNRYEQLRAFDGVLGLRGNDGFGGLPGGPGGIFIGITNEIVNEASLGITADGGNGGQGQDGGNGGNGFKGLSPKMKPELIERFPSANNNWQGCNGTTVRKFIIMGEEGRKGGAGGDGGEGGKGGKAGQIHVYQLNPNNLIIRKQATADGKKGLAGIGGKGGQGGQHGDNIEMSYCEDSGILFNKTEQNVFSFNERGKDGTPGASIFLPQDTEDFEAFGEVSKVVNNYKQFLRTHMHDSLRNESLAEFYNHLITNEEINKQYETFALLDELKGLEEQYLELRDLQNLQVWYNSLKHRIRNYTENRLERESSDEYKTALDFAYEVATNKANGSTTREVLVTNLNEFLNTVDKNLDVVIKKRKTLKNNPQDDIILKIKQTSDFVKTQIKDKLLDAENENQKQILHSIVGLKDGVLKVDNTNLLKLRHERFSLGLLRTLVKVEGVLILSASITAKAALFKHSVQLSSEDVDNLLETFNIIGEYQKSKDEPQILRLRTGGQNKNELMDSEEKLFSILIPFIKQIRLVFTQYSSSLNTMISDILKLKVQKTVTMINNYLESIQKDFYESDVAFLFLQKTKDSFNTLNEIYDQLEKMAEEQTSSTAEYLDIVNFPNFPNNKKLQETVDGIKLMMQTNFALLQYERAYKAFEIYAFPYAENYFFDFDPEFVHEIDDLESLIDKASNNTKLMSQRHSNNIYKKNENINYENIGPISVWRNESYSDLIATLLEGKEVTLVPDARDYGQNAVKFRNINLYFKTLNDDQEFLNEKLKNVSIKMSHDGNSYYKCGEKLFLISHEPFDLIQSFNTTISGFAKDFSRGDFMVSPFAKWTVKLDLKESNLPDYYFHQFRNQTDLIMEASASYVPSYDTYICNTTLETYYKQYTLIERFQIG